MTGKLYFIAAYCILCTICYMAQLLNLIATDNQYKTDGAGLAEAVKYIYNVIISLCLCVCWPYSLFSSGIDFCFLFIKKNMHEKIWEYFSTKKNIQIALVLKLTCH